MKWLKFILEIIFAVVGWLSSTYFVYSSEKLSFGLRIAIIVAIVVIAAIYALVQFNSFRATFNSSVHKSKDKVNKYLLNWLDKGTRTVIFTRDLTWADESSEILQTLERKAQKSELTICLYRKTKTTEHLKELGAEVYIHNMPESKLKSRFTIIDYGTHNPKITVGTRDGSGKFVNERYDMKTNPNACNAFIEMFELVKNQHVEDVADAAGVPSASD